MLHDQDFIRIVRMRRRVFVILFAVALIFSVAIAVKKIYFTRLDIPARQTFKEVMEGYKKATIHADGGNVELLLETADTPEKQQEGLMFRHGLARNSGMLFIFDTDTSGAFWMKNTLLPLDILFIGADMRIVDFTSMEPCKANPCPFYRSRIPYRYALEVNSGFILEKKVRIGNVVEL